MLHVPRSSYYYKPHEDLHKRCIDATAKDEIMQIYSETPFYGIRRITRELHRRGYRVNHKRVRRLRRETGLRTIYPRPHFSTSEPHPEHEKYPYLLKNLSGLRDCHRGLVQPQEHGVQRREHDGHVPLRRNAPARGEQIRSPGDIQFGSGKPVHQPRVHGRAKEARNRHQHGRTRTVP